MVEHRGQLGVVQDHRRHPAVIAGPVDLDAFLQPLQWRAQGLLAVSDEEVGPSQWREGVGDAASFHPMAGRAILAVKFGPVGSALAAQ